MSWGASSRSGGGRRVAPRSDPRRTAMTSDGPSPPRSRSGSNRRGAGARARCRDRSSWGPGSRWPWDFPTPDAEEFAKHASGGDIFVDGGNSNFHDSQRRARQYAARGFSYLDVGVSGGVWGLKVGYCMMVGGPADAVATVAPLLDTLAPPNGWAH